MATQEIHYASMAQVVDTSSVDSAIMQDPKKLPSMEASSARLALSVWMTNFRRSWLGGARNWINLIKVTVPATTMRGPPLPGTDPSMHLDYYRDIFSLITLDTNAVVSDFDLKTWGILVYPEDEDKTNISLKP